MVLFLFNNFFIFNNKKKKKKYQQDEKDVTEEKYVNVRHREVERAFEKMTCAPGNESVHNYLIGNLNPKSKYAEAVFLKSAPIATEKLLAMHSDTTCWVKASLVDIFEAAEDFKMSPTALPDICEGESRPFRDRIISLCSDLSRIDPVRSKYWNTVMSS